jgi:hypothetical protein
MYSCRIEDLTGPDLSGPRCDNSTQANELRRSFKRYSFSFYVVKASVSTCKVSQTNLEFMSNHCSFIR